MGGDAAGGHGALRDLAEQEAEEVERALLKPIGEEARSESTMSCRTLDADESVTSCQTLIASSATSLVDNRLVSSSSQGTLVASDCEPLDDDNDQDFEL